VARLIAITPNAIRLPSAPTINGCRPARTASFPVVIETDTVTFWLVHSVQRCSSRAVTLPPGEAGSVVEQRTAGVSWLADDRVYGKGGKK